MIEQLAQWLVDFVHQFGYVGIFVMTFLESTFVPVPSEVTMVPAGYLVQQGHMHWFWVFLASVTGTVCGSYANYWVAKHYGRPFFRRFGKYMLFPPEKMEKFDRFFASHGEISIFTGRLIPGVRHVISFPAGLAHMNVRKFLIYTSTGGGIWMTTLMVIGYIIGGNKELVRHYMPYVTAVCVVGVIAMVVFYVIRHRKRNGDAHGAA